MKALLIQPPHYYGKNTRPPQQFHLGLGYIARSLKNKGHELEVLDIYAHQYSDGEVENKINGLGQDIDVVCISALSTQYKYTKWLIKKLKARFDKPIIVGNALATFSTKILLENSDVDICVIGEGEETIVELLDNLGSVDKVLGVSYRKNGKICSTPPRPYIKNLDTIDPPLREVFPMSIYLDNCYLWGNPEIRATNIVTARGCPFSCRYCSKTFSGVRLRTIKNVIKEIESLREDYNVKAIYFNDELTLVNKQRSYELCDYFKKSKLRWVCQGRVDKVDMDLLKCMKDSGCVALGFGVESGSQRILDNMNKGIKIEQAIEAIKATKKVGIQPIIQMMYGYEGEDEESIAQTVSFFKTINFPTMPFSPTTPLPGTVLYANAREKGLIKNEDEYVEKLDWGYCSEREILINFTKFSNEEFTRRKAELERTINSNYRKYLTTHPWVALKIIFKKIRSYYERYGLLKTFKRMTQFKSYLEKERWMI